MRNIFKLSLLVALLFNLASCNYNKYDAPTTVVEYTDEDFADCTYISIKDLKQMFYDEYGTAGLAKTLEIRQDYYISGKVISSDEAGNVYKSLYIYDDKSESAIELRMMVSNHVYYQLGQTIYVRVNGLAIGNYRYMLSLGLPPTPDDIVSGYANCNMENSLYADAHVFCGALGEITEDDILVINEDNYTSLTDDNLGRLVRFEGISYKEGTYDSDVYPNYLEVTYPYNTTTGVYTNRYYEEEGLTETYAYSYDGDKYYGSAVFGYGSKTDFGQTNGNFVVRVSGYANFALTELPENGAVGNMTAIYTKYSSSSGGYVKYQLVLNDISDVDFQ